MAQPKKPGSSEREIHTLQEQVHRSPFSDLAAAVIVRAAEDYIEVIRSIRQTTRNTEADDRKLTALRGEKRSLENFFRSKRYATLTDIDPDQLMQQCRIRATISPAPTKEPATRSTARTRNQAPSRQKS